jgi:hypothetical protein
MLVWITAHSNTLLDFLMPLLLGLSEPQCRHALNVVEALLVCGALKHKTLAALTRVLGLPHADQYACADFFRASPWDYAPVRWAVTLFLLRTVAAIQQKTGWRLLFISVDDALAQKDIATEELEAVDWHHDHVTQRRQKGQNTKGSKYVCLHLQLGPVQFTLNWRVYLKRKQVKRLNSERRKQGLDPLQYAKLSTLVMDMLTEIVPHLPTGCRVYVLFDAWYDGHELEAFIRSHGWHWICATRYNRVVNDRSVSLWWSHLGHQRIARVHVRSATRSRTYLTRHVVGRLRRYPDPVVAIISKRDRRDTTPAYFLCSDTTLSVQTILKYYGYRWQTEVDNWYLKERFGLADYRLHSLEAILRWHTLVFATYAFTQYRRAVPLLTNPKATLPDLSEVLTEHQTWHTRQTVSYIAALAREGKSDAEIAALLMPA